ERPTSMHFAVGPRPTGRDRVRMAYPNATHIDEVESGGLEPGGVTSSVPIRSPAGLRPLTHSSGTCADGIDGSDSALRRDAGPPCGTEVPEHAARPRAGEQHPMEPLPLFLAQRIALRRGFEMHRDEIEGSTLARTQGYDERRSDFAAE